MATPSSKDNATKAPEKAKKRQLKKTLAAFTPFVKWHAGLLLIGTIVRKFTNHSEYGEKENLEVRLVEPCSFTSGDGEVVELLPGDLINVGKVAGLTSAMTLSPDTLVQIECTGKKEMGKGRQPAWEFEVQYE